MCSEKSFDLTPHPRILPMLGEIVLPQWKCLAELVDNSVDSFLEASRAGNAIVNPKVIINIPTGGAASAQLSIRDNGPGMNAETLERAARAGWSSHDPINNLGLFGMGFNIATARIGHKTTIWTKRNEDNEWVGLEIDFEELTRQKAFITPILSRPAEAGSSSGTEIVIDKMKPDQREWFGRSYNRTNLSRQLGRIYSSMIGPAGSPIRFALQINETQVRPVLHCVWGGVGSDERTVETAKYGPINAFQQFDSRLDTRPFCKQCFNWLAIGEVECSLCGEDGLVVPRERRVHGWIGIQRYLDTSEYGIDFLRNGRKIEIGNKDLFNWYNENTNSDELEYPIDDPRNRGRIVGEVHIDHGRIPYTKDRFVRDDPAWQEMIDIVRGKGPLRPDKRTELGYGENSTPLFKLFQAFRRSVPHNRRAPGWNKMLVVPDNDLSKTMAKNFEAGEVEYQSDKKWWDLVEEAEVAVISTPPAGGGTIPPLGGGGAPPAPGPVAPPPLGGQPPLAPPPRHPLASLTRVYTDVLSGQRYEIKAFHAERHDPILGTPDIPWSFRRTTTGPWEFFVHSEHEVFNSMTMTPMDALLSQIAWQICDYERGQPVPRTFAAVIASLRAQYASATQLDPSSLINEASGQLNEIAASLVGKLTPEDSRAFYAEMGPSPQETIRVTMASRGVVNPGMVIDQARFFQYTPPRAMSAFILAHPEFFFDGRYWDDQYEALDLGSVEATDAARKGILAYYGGLLADVTWLAQQIPTELESHSRERLMRASLATALISRSSKPGSGG